MKTASLSYNSRKALIVNIGEKAGIEIADLIAQMASEIEELRRTKVNVSENYSRCIRTARPRCRRTRIKFEPAGIS